MSRFTHRLRLLSLVVVFSAVAIPARAGNPMDAADAYVEGYSRMGKAAAMMFGNENTRANAQNNAMTAMADAQAKMLSAQAAWLTAVANAAATEAKTQQTLEQTRTLALENELKATKTFYEKRQLHDEFQKQRSPQPTSPGERVRTSKAPVLARPASFEFDSRRGKVYWPEVFLSEEFSDARANLDALFAQRHDLTAKSSGSIAGQVNAITAEMTEQLREKIREMSPAEYLAAKKFLESLAYEVQFPPQIVGVASN